MSILSSLTYLIKRRPVRGRKTLRLVTVCTVSIKYRNFLRKKIMKHDTMGIGNCKQIRKCVLKFHQTDTISTHTCIFANFSIVSKSVSNCKQIRKCVMKFSHTDKISTHTCIFAYFNIMSKSVYTHSGVRIPTLRKHDYRR